MTRREALDTVARPDTPSVAEARKERERVKQLSAWAKQANAARNAKLSPERRSEIARKAGRANADRLARLKALEDGLKLLKEDGR